MKHTEETAALFVDNVFRHYDKPATIVSNRDSRFTVPFWSRLVVLLDTRHIMSTTDHPETDAQTERVNQVLEDVLRSFASSLVS